MQTDTSGINLKIKTSTVGDKKRRSIENGDSVLDIPGSGA